MESHRRPRPEGIWQAMADLESRMDAEVRQQELIEAHELRQAEEQSIAMATRLQASEKIQIRLSGGAEYFDMSVSEVASTWLVGQTARGESLLPLEKIEAVRGLSVRSQPLRTSISSSLSFRSRLRGMGTEFQQISVETDAATYRGRFVAVGADWVDIETRGERVSIMLHHVRRVDVAR